MSKNILKKLNIKKSNHKIKNQNAEIRKTTLMTKIG